MDWSKPVLWQVGSLGAMYHKWVHLPVDRPLRLFRSDFVEFFSQTPWFVVPIVWLPVVAYLAILCTMPEQTPWWLQKGSKLPAFSFACLFILGVLMWTLVEYGLHRFVFHLSPPDNSPFLITAHFLLHGQHHKVIA